MRAAAHHPAALFAAALAVAPLLVGCMAEDSAAPASLAAVDAAAAPPAPAADAEPAAPSPEIGAPVGPTGEGFVVWESNRDGGWRIWTRELAPGAVPRRLSPAEPGRVHCCPHLSPDGTRLVYLSLPPGGEAYKPGRTTGPLRLLDLGSGEEQELAATARNYFENRAAVWRGDGELIYIAGDGHTVLLDLESGAGRRLTDRPVAEHGWLLDPRLAFATGGRPSFSPYDPERRLVAERAERGGCQPYFTSDGRWGFWVAGAGGPVNRLELATGAVSTILRKSDPRMVGGYGYAYFPMFSTDRRAFVYAASPGEHDHVGADYEIFVVAADPDTLELSGGARRLTENPATDRFPDVHLTPLALGHQEGEAPLRYAPTLEADSHGAWSVDFGDGDTARGGKTDHVYERPGLYAVRAERHGEILRGTVRVRPARPPSVVASEAVESGGAVRVTFDEEVEIDEARVSFTSGLAVASSSLAPDGRTLVVRLGEPLSRFERLEISGVRDRALAANTMAPATLELEPPLWPARRAGAVFLWRTGDAPNLFFDAAAGLERAGLLAASGRAFLDRRHRMTLRGGSFAASAEESNRLRWALQASNELGLELTIEPWRGGAIGDRALVVFGQRGQPPNFSLVERDGELFYNQRVSSRGPDAVARAALGPLPPGRRHLALSYAPGRLTLDVDGERVADTDAVQGDFFHWRSLPLTFGGQAGGGLEWHGAIEGVALYDRVLTELRARENFLRYRRLLERRDDGPELVVEARLVERSPTPTPAEIRPYRQGLAAHRYAIERIVEGGWPDDAPRESILVAHWELLDGARQPAAERRVGERVTLRLEPFANQPQLAAIFLSNRFAAPPRFFAVDGD